MTRVTGKERDAETGLDYFGARYFSGAQGRFTTPDWSAKPTPVPYADLTDPQTLNLYAYVRNNPLAKADPDGHDALWVVDKKAGTITLVIPVNFTGSAATSKTVAQIVQRDQSLYAPGVGATIEVIATKTPINGVLNHMDISPGYDWNNYPFAGEGANRIGGNEAHINSSLQNVVGAAAHDVLHFAGMGEKYNAVGVDSKGVRKGDPVPGYSKSNIMTDRSGTELKLEQFREAERNRTTKHCEVVDGKTTCK
jgi:RHS repeat-associated protein